MKDHRVRAPRFLRHVLVVSAALAFNACSLYFPRTPVLPERFEGPLSASADSLIATTQPGHCAPTRQLDFGTTPQGCERTGGDSEAWVNWKDPARVVKIGREWTRPSLSSALSLADSLEKDLLTGSGTPVECQYSNNYPARDVRWIASAPDGITTVVRVFEHPDAGSGLMPKAKLGFDPAAPAQVELLRVLGPERCGRHVDRPGGQ
jgi:hypothetical protein